MSKRNGCAEAKGIEPSRECRRFLNKKQSKGSCEGGRERPMETEKQLVCSARKKDARLFLHSPGIYQGNRRGENSGRSNRKMEHGVRHN